MKRYSRSLLFWVMLFSIGLQFANAGLMDVSQRRNAIWVGECVVPNAATAETSVKVDVQIEWACDYDTEVSIGIWSETDGFYVEHVPGTVGGDGSKRYMLQCWVPAVNGVHNYRVEALYRKKASDDWLLEDDGVVEFDVEVTGGKSANPLESLAGGLKMPSLSGFSIPQLPGFVGLIVGAGSVYLFMRD